MKTAKNRCHLASINSINYIGIVIISLLLFACSKKESTIEKEPKTLMNVYKDAFYIGTALNRFQINETDSVMATLIGKEFNSITAENIMKSVQIHPQRDTFDFELADKFVALGKNIICS